MGDAATAAPRVSWTAPPFGSVDTDGDGDLSILELRTLVETQSPTTFDGVEVAPSSQRTGGNGVWMPAGQRRLWEVLVAMCDEVRAAGGTPPDAIAVAAAVASSSFQSPGTQALLVALRPEWDKQGWKWPFPEATK